MIEKIPFKISGTVTYKGGEMDGKPVSGASIQLFDGKKVLVIVAANPQVGRYEIANIPKAENYTMMIYPPLNTRGYEGGNPGYLIQSKDPFKIEEDLEIDIELEYYDNPGFSERPLEAILSDSDALSSTDDQPLAEDVVITVTNAYESEDRLIVSAMIGEDDPMKMTMNIPLDQVTSQETLLEIIKKHYLVRIRNLPKEPTDRFQTRPDLIGGDK